MKLSFFKNDLLSGIVTVLKAVPSKTTMTILECIMVDATKDEITLTANDMEIAIQTKEKGSILEKGKVAIDAKLFSEIIRKLPDSEIIIEENKENISISCEKSRFNISGRCGDDFIGIPQIETKSHMILTQFGLKEVIRQTSFSISANENNKMMTGELLEIHGDRLKVVSLDGHRISIRNLTLKEEYDQASVVVPGKVLIEVARILPGDVNKDVCVSFGKNHILFSFDQTIVLSRLIEGEYFQINKMISDDFETKVTVNKKEFLEAIERSVLLVRESDKKPIIFDIKENKMELSLNSVIGSMREEIMVRHIGKDLMIGFNPRFLIEALRVIEDEEIHLYMSNSRGPCFIRDDEKNFIYLILPVNFTR